MPEGNRKASQKIGSEEAKLKTSEEENRSISAIGWLAIVPAMLSCRSWRRESVWWHQWRRKMADGGVSANGGMAAAAAHVGVALAARRRGVAAKMKLCCSVSMKAKL